MARSKCVVTAMTSRISKATDVLLSVIDQKIQQNKRIRLCDGLVDVTDHCVQLTIYNPTTKVVTLPQSMLVGSIGQLRRDEFCSLLFSNNKSEENEIARTKVKETTLGKSTVDKLTEHLQQHEEYHQQVWTLLNQHKQLFDNSHSKTIKTTVHHVHSKKNKVFAEPTKKGSVDVKSFQMSSNVERNNKKILPNLKRFFTSIQSRNLIKKTFLSFVQHLKRFRRYQKASK